MNKRECHNELDWLAFCYAAGELSVVEAEQFETRLADDQAAREALARAVELTQVVAAAEAQSGELVTLAVHAKSRWSTRLSWMAVGGLASLLLALLWSGVVGPTWQTAQRQFNSAEQRELALAWNLTRTEIADVREAGLWPYAGAVSDADDDLSSDMRMDNLGLDESPSWMTAAVFGQAAGDSDQPADAFSNESSLEN